MYDTLSFCEGTLEMLYYFHALRIIWPDKEYPAECGNLGKAA